MELKQTATALVGDWKLHFALAGVIGVLGIALATMGPTLATIVTFFWPLVVSTVFLLSAIAVLFRISPPPSDPFHEEIPGQELMQYVAGCPDEVLLEMPERLDRVYQPEKEEGEMQMRIEEESVKEQEQEQEEEEERRESPGSFSAGSILGDVVC